MMHRLLVGLVAIGCSGAPGRTGDETTGPETDEPGNWQGEPAAYELGTPGSPGVWVPPYDCWEGCSVANDVVAGQGAPCIGLKQVACEAKAGWLSSPQGPGTVPGCGQVGLYLESCFWNGSSCGAGSFYQAFQTCKP